MCQMCVCVCTCATVHVVCMCVFCLHVRAYEAGYISYVHLGLCSLLMPALDLSFTLFPPPSLPALPPPPCPSLSCQAAQDAAIAALVDGARVSSVVDAVSKAFKDKGQVSTTDPQEQNPTPIRSKTTHPQEQNHTPIRSKTIHPSGAKPHTHQEQNHVPTGAKTIHPYNPNSTNHETLNLLPVASEIAAIRACVCIRTTYTLRYVYVLPPCPYAHMRRARTATLSLCAYAPCTYCHPVLTCTWTAARSATVPLCLSLGACS